MWLRELKIRNFRKIDTLTVSFPRGLTVLVGENNSGKTTIIDALRLMLFPSRDFDSLRLSENDFRVGTEHAPIEVSCTFAGLEDEDEVHFQECLVDIGDGKFEMQVNARVEFNETTNRCNVKMWGGETEGGSLPSNHYDQLSTIYLQPLRDPQRGLRPGQYSQVSRLIDRLTEENQRADFEAIARDANENIRTLKPVDDARRDINAQMVAIAGSELTQKSELIFTDPTFRRIIAGLQPEIEGLPFALNGLGYNNLIFTSATLGTLRRSPQFSFRSILVEEPEAHLHPQLQMLFLRHLANVASNPEGNEVQVIASSHSPILASQAPIDSVVSVHECDGKVSTVSVCSITIGKKIKKKLQRYLDATRGELFFARRILMVEGIAEALLLPVLAKMSGGNLKESSVTVLNADGINFNAFIPLFGTERLGVPVVILTDGDAKEIGGERSATAAGLKALESDVPNLAVEMSEVTFEHELARSDAMLPHMIAAFKELHPKKGATLELDLGSLASADDRADAFLSTFLASRVFKGQFAQELAGVLDGCDLGPDAVPTYIRNALKHLGVLREGANDDLD
ncbi:MAG: AAA family ATPase [Gemmatimonadetes bacterium]|nr:AAA family ATPase [Gemmatimonadota bacterium]MYG24392.1 AAA family ATPase [Gemmatimonadota bacterium]MYJ37945.1 AAA family ATPase [Gemmatimonadota bacterium]